MTSYDTPIDMEEVLYLAKHIEHPCEVIVDGRTENIQELYLNEARKLLPELTNPFAKDFLESLINKYSNQLSQ